MAERDSSNAKGARPGSGEPISEPDSEPSVIRIPRQGVRRPPDLELHEAVRSSKPGTRILRRGRLRDQKLLKVGEGEFEATQAALTP